LESKWEVKREKLEKTKHKAEVVFEIVLIIGLALELWAMPNHMKEAEKSHEQVKQLESTNLLLSIELAILNAKHLKAEAEFLEWQRPMSAGDIDMFGAPIALRHGLRAIPRANITIVNTTANSALYAAIRFKTAFELAGGWKVESLEKRFMGDGVYIAINDWMLYQMSDVAARYQDPLYKSLHLTNFCYESGWQLLKLMTDLGLPTGIGNPLPDFPVPTNSIMIFVGERPSILQTKWIVVQAKKKLLDHEENEVHAKGKLGPDGKHDTEMQEKLRRIYDRRRELSAEDDVIHDLRKQTKSLFEKDNKN